MLVEDRSSPFRTSRRRVLQAAAVTIGAGLLGVHGAVVAGARLDGTGAGEDGAPPPPGSPPNRMFASGPSAPTSYNGWTVGTPGSVIGVQNFTVPGTSVVLPIRSGDVATVLLYVAQRFNTEVETLEAWQCWGYDYRPNVNNPSVWSNHASGTAIDLNAVKHPNGATGTYTAGQTAAVRRILAACGRVVYWGQDYSGVVDGMHFEINVPPGDPGMTRLAASLRGGGTTPSAVYVPGIDSFVDSGGTRRVFGISAAGKLTELTGGSGGWQTFDASAGGYVRGTPAVTYRNGRCDVFAIGGDDGGWTMSRRDGGGWSSWSQMGGGNLTGGFAGVIGSGGVYHLFSVTTDGGLWQYFGSAEGGWSIQNVSNNGALRGRPAVVYQNGRYDLFGIGLDDTVWQQSYTDGDAGWAPWRRVGGSRMVGGLSALRDSNGYRVIGIDSDGKVRQFTSSNGSSWRSADISNGGTVGGTPSMTMTNGRLNVYGVGLDQQVWTEQSVNSGAFGGWQPIGGNIG